MRFKFPAPDPKDPNLTFNRDDVFGRRPFAKSLTEIIKVSEDEGLVISIESEWGAGKTSFAHKWMKELEKELDDLPAIYIDVFAHDYQSDAYGVISSEIYSFLEDRLKKNKNEESDAALENVLKGLKDGGLALTKATLKTGVNYIIPGLINDETTNEWEKNLAAEMGKVTDNWVSEAIKSKAEKEKGFKELDCALRNAVKIVSPKHEKLIVIVDELDRCRPNFALDILEVLKHFFSIKGVVFVLFNHRGQIEQSIKHIYGTTSPQLYLQKFFDISANLPMENNSNKFKAYQNFILNVMNSLSEDLYKYARFYADYADNHNVNPREIEKVFLVLHLYNNSHSNIENLESLHLYIVVGMAIIHVRNKMLLLRISKGNIPHDGVLNTLEIRKDISLMNDDLSVVWNMIGQRYNKRKTIEELETKPGIDRQVLNSIYVLINRHSEKFEVSLSNIAEDFVNISNFSFHDDDT